MFEANVLKVLISSPGDTAEEVAAVKQALYDWNGDRSEAAQAILLPRHWKSDAVPRLGTGTGQGVINETLVDSADIVIALFDSRLGQATADAVSGTAEEIQRAIDSGKHVHVWFSNEPIGRKGTDLKQLAALEKFRTSLQEQGLLGEYDSPSDLAYKVRSAIEADLNEMGLAAPTGRRNNSEHARPRAQRSGDSLLIQNRSTTVTAEQLHFEVASVWPARWGDMDDDNPPVHLQYNGEFFDLLPDSHIEWPMMVFGQSPPHMRVTMRWSESGSPREETQTIAL